jgi:Family of unknown function (DUF5681)
MTICDDGDDDDRGGYGRPPKASRYKKGQSGNPSGRKRRHRYEEEENPLRMFLLEEKTVKIAGKKVKMPAVDIITMSMINKAMAGDHRSQKLLIQESGGLKAIREEWKRQKNSADQAMIDEVHRMAKEWLRDDERSRGDDKPRDDGDGDGD